jgi:hypothetical protein
MAAIGLAALRLPNDVAIEMSPQSYLRRRCHTAGARNDANLAAQTESESNNAHSGKRTSGAFGSGQAGCREKWKMQRSCQNRDHRPR